MSFYWDMEGENGGKEQEDELKGSKVYSFILSNIGFWLELSALCLFLISPSLPLTKLISVNKKTLPPTRIHLVSTSSLDQSRFNIRLSNKPPSLFNIFFFFFVFLLSFIIPSPLHSSNLQVFLRFTTTAAFEIFTKCSYTLSFHRSTQLHHTLCVKSKTLCGSIPNLFASQPAFMDAEGSLRHRGPTPNPCRKGSYPVPPVVTHVQK